VAVSCVNLEGGARTLLAQATYGVNVVVSMAVPVGAILVLLLNGPWRQCLHEEDVAAFCTAIEDISVNGTCISHTLFDRLFDAVEEWSL